MADTIAPEQRPSNAALTQAQLNELHEARKASRLQLLGSKPDKFAYHRAVVELGLAEYAAELDALGYTVIPPELVTTPEFVSRMQATLLRIAEERTGVPHALDEPGNPGRYITSVTTGDSYLLFYLLFEDQIFEEWLENPALAAMIDHMLRGQAQLSSLVSFIRWNNPDVNEKLTLGLHSDSPGSPEGVLPLGHDLVCNAALVLSEYTEENGALAVVPGSHRLGRQPLPGEGVDDAVAVEAPVGALILWHGGTWHGAFRRTTPGIRLNLTDDHCHRALKTQERYKDDITDEVLARRSPRFARLMGADDPMGWRADGPDYAAAAAYGNRAKPVL